MILGLAILLHLLFLVKKQLETLAVQIPEPGDTFSSDIIVPSETEDLVDFDCSNLPCVILGPKTNSNGIALKERTFNIDLQNNKINNVDEARLFVNQGDKIVLEFTYNQTYYFFIPQLDLFREISSNIPLPIFIDTNGKKGKFDIVLQDGLGEGVTVNFQAGVLEIVD